MGTVQGREPEEIDYEYNLVKGNRYLIKKNEHTELIKSDIFQLDI